ncbi:MAG: GNAT family N-acetyltransferase [Clostridia bacterium]|nr:GNAT family N-acetyltransferase [Clostridia bacterium]
MLRKIRNEDIDDVMFLWRNGVYKSNFFINSNYWSNNYDKMQDSILCNANTNVYLENDTIKAFTSIKEDGEIKAFFVDEKYKRQGIGTMLMNNIKKEYKYLLVRVYEKNISSVLFFKAMGFKKISSEINKDNNEIEYIMAWDDNEVQKTNILYINDTISDKSLNDNKQNTKFNFCNINDKRAFDCKKAILYIDYNNYEGLSKSMIDYKVRYNDIDFKIFMFKPLIIETRKNKEAFEKIIKTYKDYEIKLFDCSTLKDNTIYDIIKNKEKILIEEIEKISIV